MNCGIGENDRVPWPLGQWRQRLTDDSINMRYTYVGIRARRFTYQFLGELFRVCHIWSVNWKAVNARWFTRQFLGELFRVRYIWRDTWKAVDRNPGIIGSGGIGQSIKPSYFHIEFLQVLHVAAQLEGRRFCLEVNIICTYNIYHWHVY